MSKTPRPPIIRSTVTERRYAKCLLTGGHHYGTEVVLRDFRGYQVELRVCRKCAVPEKPLLRTATTTAPHARRGGVSPGKMAT